MNSILSVSILPAQLPPTMSIPHPLYKPSLLIY